MNRHDLVFPQPLTETARRPEIAIMVDVLFHDHSADLRARGFDIDVVDTVVADQGIGECDNLAAVRGIGKDFLVPRKACVEDDFPRHFPRSAERLRNKNRPVFQYQLCFHR